MYGSTDSTTRTVAGTTMPTTIRELSNFLCTTLLHLSINLLQSVCAISKDTG